MAPNTPRWRDKLRNVRLPLHKFTSPGGERRVMVRELLVGLLNGVAFAVITGAAAFAWFKVPGLGVVIGARVGALAGPSQVLVSQTVKDLVAGSGLTFEDRGVHTLKGLPEPRQVFAVSGESR